MGREDRGSGVAPHQKTLHRLFVGSMNGVNSLNAHGRAAEEPSCVSAGPEELMTCRTEDERHDSPQLLQLHARY